MPALRMQSTLMALAATRGGMKETAVREPPARMRAWTPAHLNSSLDRAGNDETIEKTMSG
jgi:hypothetical protein